METHEIPVSSLILKAFVCDFSPLYPLSSSPLPSSHQTFQLFLPTQPESGETDDWQRWRWSNGQWGLFFLKMSLHGSKGWGREMRAHTLTLTLTHKDLCSETGCSMQSSYWSRVPVKREKREAILKKPIVHLLYPWCQAFIWTCATCGFLIQRLIRLKSAITHGQKGERLEIRCRRKER